MSDSENENYEPEGREIYCVSREKVLWIATAGSYEESGSYKVYFDEDGDQLEDTSEWWQKGIFKEVLKGLLYIKNNEVIIDEEVDDDYDLEENGWQPLHMDHIRT